MTMEELIKRLKKLGKGEFFMGDVEQVFLKTAKKSEYTVNPITGDKYANTVPFVAFVEAFETYKYGLEYATNQKMRYIGTNDLETLVIR